MNTIEIRTGLKNRLGDRCHYLGIYEENELKKVISISSRLIDKPSVFILHVLDKPEFTMGHWIVIYINYQIRVFSYLDSLNLPLHMLSKSLCNIANTIHMTVLKIPYRLQAMKSVTCGAYSMFFVYLLSKDSIYCLFKRIKRFFTKGDYIKNDREIIRVTYRIFNMPKYSWWKM